MRYYIIFIINLLQVSTKRFARATKRKLMTFKPVFNPPIKYQLYTIEHVRVGLGALSQRKSKRSAAELSGVPFNTLGRHFKALTGQNPNVKHPLTKAQRVEARRKLPTFNPARMGQGKRLFLPHEELLMVNMLEIAAEAAFPYNADALEATALYLGKAA